MKTGFLRWAAADPPGQGESRQFTGTDDVVSRSAQPALGVAWGSCLGEFEFRTDPVRCALWMRIQVVHPYVLLMI